MPPIPPSLRAARAQWRTCTQHLHASTNPKTRLYSTTRTLRSTTSTTASNPLRSAARAPRSREQDLARSKRSMYISATGMIVCAVGMYGVIKADVFGLEQTTATTTTEGLDVENTTTSGNSATKLDGPSTGFPTKPTLTHIQSASGNPDQVETGTSSIPHFPAVIHLPKWLESEETPASATDLSTASQGEEGEEYHLLGLGIRTVSFLNFQVYVVGLYVAKEDLAELQSRLVRTAVHPPGKGTESVIDNEVGATAATSLVSMEREKLRELLLDAEKGEQAWDVLLKKDGLRTAFRVVPTRNTDFLHLRDGWVRGITGRAQRYNKVEGGGKGEFEGEEFGQAMGEFKGLFGGGQRKSVPKGQVLVLARGKKGQLDVLVQGGGEGKDALPDRYLGRVKDERVSRLVWLNYLAGKNVSSEGARRSVVDGIMGVVERPVGTV